MSDGAMSRGTSQADLAALRDPVPHDLPCAAEIGFSIPATYNASEILFANLDRGLAAKPAILTATESATYEQLCASAAKTGHALSALGLRRGERILLLLDDRPAYPAIFFGAIRAGFVPMLLNTLSSKDLVQYYAQDSGARIAFVDQATAQLIDDDVIANTDIEKIVLVDVDGPSRRGATSYQWQQLIAAFPERLEAVDTHRDDMAFWMYSSGSTGRPKGIVHLQHDMLYTAESYARHILNITADDICFSVPKIFFAYGLGNSLVFPFSTGASAILLAGRTAPEKIFALLKQHRPTLFFGLPTLYNALIQSEAARGDEFSSTRICLSAAEILSQSLMHAWQEKFGTGIVEGLGSTELTHIYLSNTADHRKSGSAGRRVPGYELQLLDADGAAVPPGEEGVLWVRGDSSAPLYWNRPDETAKTMREDWICTGDRFVCDAEGFFYFRGRTDDLIKVSGQWVYPLETEQCLSNHPKVKECAVLGVPLEDRRMTLKAFVVPQAAGTASEALTTELQTYVKQTLLPYKYPRLIEYLPALPKTGTGKIDRQALSTSYETQASS